MPLIGVSIAVPDPCGRELQDYRVSLGEDDAQQIPTHITLVPPTPLDREDLAEVADHLGRTADRHPSFDVHLRGTGTFRPVSPVVFVGVVEGISSCEQLALALRSGPLETELNFPYHPHVTVAQQLPEAVLDQAFDELAGTDCRFRVTRFWLYVFDDEEGWVPTREFLLGG